MIISPNIFSQSSFEVSPEPFKAINVVSFAITIFTFIMFYQHQQYLKKPLVHFFERCFLHKLMHAKFVVCEFLFSILLQLLVSPLKTNAKYWTILSGVNAEVICQDSIRNNNYCSTSFLFGQSKVFDIRNVNTLMSFSSM